MSMSRRTGLKPRSGWSLLLLQSKPILPTMKSTRFFARSGRNNRTSLARGVSFLDIEQPDLIKSVWCTDQHLVVTLKDGRTISVPLWWYPTLFDAKPAQRAGFEIGRYGIHWPEIDEDIELAGLLVGAKAPNAKEPIPAE